MEAVKTVVQPAKKGGVTTATLSQVPRELWALIFSMIETAQNGNSEQSLKFMCAILAYRPSLTRVATLLDEQLSQNLTTLKGIMAWDKTTLQAMRPHINENARLFLQRVQQQLSYREYVDANQGFDEEVRRSINTLITQEKNESSSYLDTKRLGNTVRVLEFLLGDNNNPHPAFDLNFINCKKNFGAFLAALFLIAGLGGAGLTAFTDMDLVDKKTGTALLITAGILLTIAGPMFGCPSQTSAVAARLGNSLTKCFRNCRQPNTPHERTPLLRNESPESRVAVLPDDVDVRNDNNKSINSDDPLAKDDIAFRR